VNRRIEPKRGASAPELLLVFALIALFSVTMVTLILSGGNVYQRIGDQQEREGSARIALSYVETLIRQSDTAGGVEVVPYDGQNALALTLEGDAARYTRWLYFKDGALMECIVPQGEAPDDEVAEQVIKALDYDVTYDAADGMVHQTVGYLRDGERRELKLSVMLRSRREAQR